MGHFHRLTEICALPETCRAGFLERISRNEETSTSSKFTGSIEGGDYYAKKIIGLLSRALAKKLFKLRDGRRHVGRTGLLCV